MVGSILRVVLIPLILLCVSPSPAHPVLSNGVLGWAVIFTFTLGLSNGYFGSLPMINVSQQVENPRHRELAGLCARGLPVPRIKPSCLAACSRYHYDLVSPPCADIGLSAGLCPHPPHQTGRQLDYHCHQQWCHVSELFLWQQNCQMTIYSVHRL